jgi:hypothetical protein
MGEQASGRSGLLVLTQEIRVDREVLERHATALRDALAGTPWPEGSPMLSVVAVAVHHYYGAAESIFERIARAFEGLPERSDRWHQDLLERMTLPLEDVRPEVLRRDTARALAPVLGFRHFFRHAYAVSFDPRRLELAAEDVQRAHALLDVDLDAFEKTLLAAARGA